MKRRILIPSLIFTVFSNSCAQQDKVEAQQSQTQGVPVIKSLKHLPSTFSDLAKPFTNLATTIGEDTRERINLISKTLIDLQSALTALNKKKNEIRTRLPEDQAKSIYNTLRTIRSYLVSRQRQVSASLIRKFNAVVESFKVIALGSIHVLGEVGEVILTLDTIEVIVDLFQETDSLL